MAGMKNIILLMRPQQWLKNTFVFAPLFFNGSFLDIRLLFLSTIAFLSYSFAASAIYCFNDIWDAEVDKLHPLKCKRPIACEKISKTKGYLIAFVCIIISYILAAFTSFYGGGKLYAIILFYLLINISYCVRLKQIALVDVFIIALGFVLRILVGSIVTGIELSQWIVLMTFLLSLFLAFAKRRDDVVMYENTGRTARKNVNRYNLAFMNQVISIVASITMVCYIMYTVSDKVVEHTGSSYLYGTSVFVLAGIIRYLQLTIVDIKSGSPTKVLMTDRFVQLCIFGWIFAYFFILYY